MLNTFLMSLDKGDSVYEYLNEKIKHLDGIIPAITYKNYTHSYYVHPFKYDEDKIGIHRDKFINAVRRKSSFNKSR